MKITKFKLVDGGRSIIVDALELSRKESFLIMDKVNRERKLEVSNDVKAAVANLKYSFLNLTGHWMPPFTGYIDNQRAYIPKLKSGENARTHEMVVKLWDHTQVNGALTQDNAFMIMGQIEVLDGKTIAINTPYIREDDDFHFYNETIERIEIAHESIIDHLMSDELLASDPRKFLLKFYKDDKDHIARIEKQSEKESENELYELSSATGGIKYLAEKNPPKPGSEGNTVLHKSKDTIDKESYKETQGEDESESKW